MKSAGAALAALLILGGCTSTLGSHQPSVQTIKFIRTNEFPKMRMGTFTLAPGKPASLDRSVTMRSVTMTSPEDNSLAKYLGKTIETNLRAAGKLDESAPLTLNGHLTDNRVNTGLDKGSAHIGAAIWLLRDNQEIFRKEFTARAEWDSSFIGAIAIPEAINRYSALYETLSSMVLTDSAFMTAARTEAPAALAEAPERN